MKEFLAFTGHHYYTRGGWHDFDAAFDTLEEARASIEKGDESEDWGHVVHNGVIVWRQK